VYAWLDAQGFRPVLTAIVGAGLIAKHGVAEVIECQYLAIHRILDDVVVREAGISTQSPMDSALPAVLPVPAPVAIVRFVDSDGLLGTESLNQPETVNTPLGEARLRDGSPARAILALPENVAAFKDGSG